MADSIHHINFLVRDLDAAVERYEQILNRPVDERDELPERGVDIARFRLGDTWLSLVCPNRPGTVPAKHLEEHGEGFFLLSLEVASLDAEIERLGEAAFASPARTGLEGWAIRDLDVKNTFGAQLQLCEPKAEPANE